MQLQISKIFFNCSKATNNTLRDKPANAQTAIWLQTQTFDWETEGLFNKGHSVEAVFLDLQETFDTG